MIHFSSSDIFLVSGASSGLGQASALLLNELGATVIGIGRDSTKLLQTKAACKNADHFFPEVKDLSVNVDELSTWVRTLSKTYGKLTGLLAAAGMGSRTPISSQDTSQMQELFTLNVFALFQLTRGFLDRRANIGVGSSVVFLASSSVWHESAGLSAYAASKGSVVALTRGLALEYASKGIRINAVAPGLIPTPMTEESYEDLKERCATYPLGAGTREDVANACAFLLSKAARWITGQTLLVDGGKSLL